MNYMNMKDLTHIIRNAEAASFLLEDAKGDLVGFLVGTKACKFLRRRNIGRKGMNQLLDLLGLEVRPMTIRGTEPSEEAKQALLRAGVPRRGDWHGVRDREVFLMDALELEFLIVKKKGLKMKI